MSQHQQANQEKSQGQQIQVSADDATLKGVYTNNVSVMYSPEEFVLDFMNLFPPKGVYVSRVIMSPGHMKRLVMVLQENIKKYEEQFKVNIQPSDKPENHFGFNIDKAN